LPFHRTTEPDWRLGRLRSSATDEALCDEFRENLVCEKCAVKREEMGAELRRQMAAYGLRRDIETGLLNFHSFQKSLADLLRDGPPDQEIALLWIDLLNLRREYSLRGCGGSDALVRHVARVLRSVVDADDLLCRFSGQCFVVSMRARRWDRNARRRIQAVADALSLPGERAEEERPEIAAGVAFYPADTTSAEDLVRFACLAAARAGHVKAARPTVMNFHGGMNKQVMREYQLELEMRKGLDLDQFRVVYQPKIDLQTGAVLGAETLLRWEHPDLDVVEPSEFIPIAERSELIHRVFEFTLRSALKDVQTWARCGLSVPSISVNASAANLRRDDFARMVQEVLQEIPIAPTRLELEVTESVLFDDEILFTKRVRQLQEIGVRISIDDFGTRYTGFNVLLHLPLAEMKIDRCFVSGIDRSPDMRALCQTIVAMARQLKMHSIAEGIEEPGELESLRELGCEAGQGYLFQPPSPAREFTAFLLRWPVEQRQFGFVAAREAEEESLVGIA